MRGDARKRPRTRAIWPIADSMRPLQIRANPRGSEHLRGAGAQRVGTRSERTPATMMDEMGHADPGLPLRVYPAGDPPRRRRRRPRCARWSVRFRWFNRPEEVLSAVGLDQPARAP